MNNSLLTVCLITYNQRKFIEQAINSILMQRVNFGWEVIIADDCSTDGTREIILEYKKQYPDMIKLILQEKNVGATPNWIDLMTTPKSKYIAYLDGDDYWTDPNKLQKQVEFLEKTEEYSMCFTDSVIVDENNFVTKFDRVDEINKKDITQVDILNGFVPPTNTVVYKNEYFQKSIANFPKITNGDYYISVLMANYGIIGYLNCNTAAYRIHQTSSWSQLPDEKRRQVYTKTVMSLKGKVQKSLEKDLENLINTNMSILNDLNKNEDFLDKGYWTPQTAMLRSIRDAILKIDGSPQNALSVDNNPSIEKMLLCKWPELEISKTQWPEHDAQNLHQFKDETFDIVFSHQVLEHIPKPWLAASEMNRVLKKGGIGIHSSCAYNPRHGYPEFKDYYRFLPDGLAELFDGVNIWVKEGWGSKEALIYNLTIDDGHGQLGGRRFVEALGKKNDENYPWHTWVIFQKQ